MHQTPETGVVEVIDMTVHLPPAQVVPQVLQTWVEDHAGIERGWVAEGGGGEVVGPEEHVGRGELGDKGGHQFAIVCVGIEGWVSARARAGVRARAIGLWLGLGAKN